jgi:hypothetical protein
MEYNSHRLAISLKEAGLILVNLILVVFVGTLLYIVVRMIFSWIFRALIPSRQTENLDITTPRQQTENLDITTARRQTEHSNMPSGDTDGESDAISCMLSIMLAEASALIIGGLIATVPAGMFFARQSTITGLPDYRLVCRRDFSRGISGMAPGATEKSSK